MKRTLFSILFLLVSIISGAQVKNVKLFEFEANVGFLVYGKYGYNKVPLDLLQIVNSGSIFHHPLLMRVYN